VLLVLDVAVSDYDISPGILRVLGSGRRRRSLSGRSGHVDAAGLGAVLLHLATAALLAPFLLKVLGVPFSAPRLFAPLIWMLRSNPR
jgi:hypothetical protein